MHQAVSSAYEYAKSFLGNGAVADYIPELAKANPNHLAVSVTPVNGPAIQAGDTEANFTIQSISKVISLAVALEENGPKIVFQHVGKEATGDAFNSILRLETNPRGIPSNPFINAGAISICALIQGANPQQRFEKILQMAKIMMGSQNITLDEQTYQSESLTGNRNRALAYLMRANDVFGDRVDEHLEVYFKACSMQVNCQQLSHLGAFLANDGKEFATGKQVIKKETIRIIRSLMIVAGMYDASGTFAVDMGYPAKSGVGGGIVGVIPGKMGIGVFSPALDETGNSYCGLKALESLGTQMDLFCY